MKPLKLWSILILIASGLLLSAKSGVTEGAKKSNQGRQTKAAASAHSQIPGLSITPTFQPTAKPSAQQGATYIYNQYQKSSPWGDLPTWLEAIATIGLVAFAALQMYFIRRTTGPTESAAEASKSAAELTKLALKAERPYIFVEAQKLIVRPETTFGSLANLQSKPTGRIDVVMSCQLRNRGKGVGIVRSVQTRILLFPLIDSSTARKTIGISREYRAYVIGPGEAVNHTAIGFKFEENDWNDLGMLSTGVIVVGIVVYEDVFENHYSTSFAFDYSPPMKGVPETGFPSVRGYLIPRAGRYNRFT